MKKKHSAKDSYENITLLAQELALNYFNASSLDLYPKLDRESAAPEIDSLKKIVFDNEDENIKIEDTYGIPQLQPKNGNIENKYSRNILVIGAGCSFNSFQNIPKGNEAIELIKRKIFVTEFSGKDISLHYFLLFAEEFENQLLDLFNKNHIDKVDFFSINQQLNIKSHNKFLLKQFSKDYSFMREIANKYLSGIRKWNLINSIYSRNSEKADFETFLGTLSDIFPMDMVRNALFETYNFKYAPTLFYSVIAHLFKNRFIDVIINFNFDELLDQAIIDEIGTTGFDRIISDGDCVPLSELSYGGRLRQPLYIKPHGTVSHKSSLRFTKDQYHNLPGDIRQTLIDLFSCSKERPKKKINLICVGFDMQSIEFNEIISNNLPKSSSLFFFFNNSNDDKKFTNNKARTKTKHLAKIFKNQSNCPKIFLIGNEYFCKEEFAKTKLNYFNFLDSEGKGLSNYFGSLGNAFNTLHLLILHFYSKKFRPREIHKHLLICSIFGNEKYWKLLNSEESLIDEQVPNTKNHYSTEYYKSHLYFLDRVVIELTINLTMNNGKIDPSRFMEGTGGFYYSKYLKDFEDKNIHRLSIEKENPVTLLEIMKLFDFVEDENVDSLGIRVVSNIANTPSENFEEIFNQSLMRSLNSKILSPYLKAYLLNINKPDENGCDRFVIRKLFDNILTSNNSKIYSEFRSTGNHIYDNYSSSDIINTDLQLDLNFHIGLTKTEKVNTICAVADYGYQLAKFLRDIVEYKKKNMDKLIRIFLIIENQHYSDNSFNYKVQRAIDILKNWDKEYFEESENNRLLNEIVKISILDVHDHNRHMIFFMSLHEEIKSFYFKDFLNQTDEVSRAIYYYKKGVSTKINPIRIEEKRNIKYLLEMFGYYSKKANTFIKNEFEKELDDWIVDFD